MTRTKSLRILTKHLDFLCFIAKPTLHLHFPRLSIKYPFYNILYRTGMFQDGWIGEEMMINFGEGPRNRSIEIRLSAPPWLPVNRVKLKLRYGGKIVQRLRIRRGGGIALSQPLPQEQGCFTLTVASTFRPSECTIGEDNRALGVKCDGCWLIHPDRERTSLMKIGK